MRQSDTLSERVTAPIAKSMKYWVFLCVKNARSEWALVTGLSATKTALFTRLSTICVDNIYLGGVTNESTLEFRPFLPLAGRLLGRGRLPTLLFAVAAKGAAKAIAWANSRMIWAAAGTVPGLLAR
jgi:hypothetical protein